MDSFTAERFRSTGVVWFMSNSKSSQDASGIGCRMSKGGVSMHCAHSKQIEARVVNCKEYSKCVLEGLSTTWAGLEKLNLATDIVA